jgi:methionyl-tRNA formyltransferase
MDIGMDTGPILLQKTIPISPDDTYIPLQEKMADIGAQTLLEAIPPYTAGTLTPTPQTNDRVTVCKQLTREDGRIDWQKDAADIYNQYRGMTPWPGVWSTWKDKRIKFLNIRPTKKNLPAGAVVFDHDTLYIGCKKQAIEVTELQLEGKKSMNATMFIHGYQEINGASLL